MDGEGRPKLLLSFGIRGAEGLGSATMRGEITRSLAGDSGRAPEGASEL